MMIRYAAVIFMTIFMMLIAALVIGQVYGLRLNTTDSMPQGIWRIEPLHQPVERGTVVLFCLPPTTPDTPRERNYIGSGSCPGHNEPLFKPVVATAGDIVDVTEEGIKVNGELIPNSVPLTQDGANRPLHPVAIGRYRTPPGYVWLISNYNKWSFDGRYFGPVPVAYVIGSATPVWTTQ